MNRGPKPRSSCTTRGRRRAQTHPEAAEFLVTRKQAHYLLVVKANQPTLLDRCTRLPWHRVPAGDRTPSAAARWRRPPPPQRLPGRYQTELAASVRETRWAVKSGLQSTRREHASTCQSRGPSRLADMEWRWRYGDDGALCGGLHHQDPTAGSDDSVNSLTRESTELYEELEALEMVPLALQRLGQPTTIERRSPPRACAHLRWRPAAWRRAALPVLDARRCHSRGGRLDVWGEDAPWIKEPMMRVLWREPRERSASSWCRGWRRRVPRCTA